MILKEKIIVLRLIKSGESDVVVHGLNPMGARMAFYARGAMKSRKRFAGGILEPTHYIEVSYKQRPGGDALEDPLHTLLEATVVRDFPKLRQDYDRLEAALHLVRVAHRLAQPGVIDSPDLFNLLGNALRAAETSCHLENLKLHFELKILASQGILPHDEAFVPWLRANLANHEQLKADGVERHRLVSQAHSVMRTYLDR